MNAPSKPIPMGQISGVHGIRGWVKVFSYTDPREAIGNYGQWWLDQDQAPIAVVQARRHGKTVVAQLQGITTPEQAKQLVGKDITVPRSDLSPADQETYYWVDLIGLEVVTTEGVSLGKVTKMIETGANDVMVVCGERERLLPFVLGQYVKQVDLDTGLLQVDWDPDF